MKKALAAIRPYRKAIVGALIAGAGAVLVQLDGAIDWKAVGKAALSALVTGAGVYQTTNTPTE
jgi:hypothetical protein